MDDDLDFVTDGDDDPQDLGPPPHAEHLPAAAALHLLGGDPGAGMGAPDALDAMDAAGTFGPGPDGPGGDGAILGNPPDPSEGVLNDLPNFDPGAGGYLSVIGDPAGDMDNWHQQAYPDTCAVATQEFILDDLSGTDFSEHDLRQEALDNGWYEPGGTPMDKIGNLLEAHGCHVDRQLGATWDDLTARLANGEKVIVGVDSHEIWTPGQDAWQDDLVGDYPGIPGQGADHAVQVIGIVDTDWGQRMVVLNDPGHPDGRGLMVPADEFMGAWQDSGNYMVSTDGRSGGWQIGDAAAGGPRLGGYMNSDGTYHYTSDNTDRDPETGAIIRRW